MNIASTCLSVSFVVPALNEEGTIEALVDRLHAAMRDRGDNSYEIILIDDGSSDRSWPIMLGTLYDMYFKMIDRSGRGIIVYKTKQ